MNNLSSGVLAGDLHEFLTGEEIGKLGEDFLILAHTIDRVFFATAKRGALSESMLDLSTDSLRELRAFNKTGELHIWKRGEGIGWRLRIEDDPETAKYHQEEHILWGYNITRESTEGLLLKESRRGFSFFIPHFVGNFSLPLKLNIRNYFDFDEDGLIRFIDARLVSLNDQEGRELTWYV